MSPLLDQRNISGYIFIGISDENKVVLKIIYFLNKKAMATSRILLAVKYI